jgi:uncharacterized protein YndB with AHSA1/START domain
VGLSPPLSRDCALPASLGVAGDIFHELPIAVEAERVYRAVSTPTGLDQWWTKRSSGRAQLGAQFDLWFGPEYQWQAQVTECVPGEIFEIEMTTATRDWLHTRVGFELVSGESRTQLQFHHTGWQERNEHFRVSSYCWAMYLRVLKRWLEHGEVVEYERRLDV